jgi:lysyl-tRNA synthetase class 2
MADERELIAARERKVAELRQAGQNPYANGFAPRHTIAELLAWFEGGNTPPDPTDATALAAAPRFSIAGRIVAFRGFGKATFVKLRDRSGEVQAWVRSDVIGETPFAIWKLMERGDFVGVEGAPVLTKTGERTLLADRVHP